MSKVQIKFGKIDRAEPLSVGGDGMMDILARVGRGEWERVGSVDVYSSCIYESAMRSSDRYAVDEFKAVLFGGEDDEDANLSVECFRSEAIKGSWRSRVVRIRTAAEARRILKEKIIEALSA